MSAGCFTHENQLKTVKEGAETRKSLCALLNIRRHQGQLSALARVWRRYELDSFPKSMWKVLTRLTEVTNAGQCWVKRYFANSSWLLLKATKTVVRLVDFQPKRSIIFKPGSGTKALLWYFDLCKFGRNFSYSYFGHFIIQFKQVKIGQVRINSDFFRKIRYLTALNVI